MRELYNEVPRLFSGWTKNAADLLLDNGVLNKILQPILGHNDRDTLLLLLSAYYMIGIESPYYYLYTPVFSEPLDVRLWVAFDAIDQVRKDQRELVMAWAERHVQRQQERAQGGQ